jgi:hypothetical protein
MKGVHKSFTEKTVSIRKEDVRRQDVSIAQDPSIKLRLFGIR